MADVSHKQIQIHVIVDMVDILMWFLRLLYCVFTFSDMAKALQFLGKLYFEFPLLYKRERERQLMELLFIAVDRSDSISCVPDTLQFIITN